MKHVSLKLRPDGADRVAEPRDYPDDTCLALDADQVEALGLAHCRVGDVLHAAVRLEVVRDAPAKGLDLQVTDLAVDDRASGKARQADDRLNELAGHRD